jgi:ketosteroid isomerase-like protein
VAEEPTTPDLAEIRRGVEAESYDEFAAFVERSYAVDAVLDMSRVGLGPFEGLTVILAFLGEYWSMWEEHHHHLEDIVVLDHGVACTVIAEDGRMKGSRTPVEARNAWVSIWDGGKIVRNTLYTDIGEARAAAKRLAEERGSAVSANLDLVRSLYADWACGDFSRADWAHPEIEFVIADGPEPGRSVGMGAMAQTWRKRISAVEDLRVAAEEYRELGDDRVLVLVHDAGRGSRSGIDIDRMGSRTAAVFQLKDGKVTRLVIYWDRERALADLGLEE